MKRVLPKLIIFHGSNTDNWPQLTNTPGNYLFHLANLKKLFEVIEIGDPKRGFNHQELNDLLAGKIEEQEESLNIVLSMHGWVQSGKYALQTTDGVVLAKGFVSELVRATGGKKLNILNTACYGARLQDALELLPKGSVMISLSDQDRQTINLDSYHKDMSTMFDAIAEHSPEQKFSIFHLLEMYCFCQRDSRNTPIIGTVDESGAVMESLSNIGTELLKHFKASLVLNNLFEKDIVSKSKVNTLIEKLNKGESIENFKISGNLPKEYMIHAANGTLNAFKQQLEQQYYSTLDLDVLELDVEKFFGKDLKILVDKRQKAKKHLDKLVKTQLKYTNLYSYIKVMESKKNNTVSKIRTKLELKAIKAKVVKDLEDSIVSIDNVIMKDIEKNYNDKEYRDDMTISWLHAPNNKVLVDLNDPINNALPTYSQLLGLAVDCAIQFGEVW